MSTSPHILFLNTLLIPFSLNQQDRDLLKSAAGKAGLHAGIASGIGLGLGVYFAFRLRNMRLAYFRAFRAMEKPVEVRFADGRTGEYPFSLFLLLTHKAMLIHLLLQNPFQTSHRRSLGLRAGAMPPRTSCSLSAAYFWAERWDC